MPNKPVASEERNLSPYLQHLRELPFVKAAGRTRALPRPEGPFDAVVALTLTDGKKVKLLVELKSSHLPANVAQQLEALHRHFEGDWILMAPYVGAPLGAALEERGINFVDREGNCHLRIDDGHVARIQGRVPPKKPARGRALRAPGYQVMFALLAQPSLLEAPQRDLARAAGTSRQPVADLLARLTEERLLVRRRGQHAWVDGPNAALLERWLAGYRATLRPRLEVGRFRLPVREPHELEAWLEARLDQVRYGGTAGAYRLSPHYRGPLTVAHLGPPSEALRRKLKALRAADGELAWLRGIGEVSAMSPRPDTVHPLLVYAELVADPDPRAADAAVRIRDEYLPWSR